MVGITGECGLNSTIVRTRLDIARTQEARSLIDPVIASGLPAVMLLQNVNEC